MKQKADSEVGADTEMLLRLEFFIAAVLLLLDAGMATLNFYVSANIFLFSFLLILLFLPFAFLYVLREPSRRPWRKPGPRTLLLHALFILVVASFVMIFVGDWKVSGLLLAVIMGGIAPFWVLFMALMSLFLLVSIGVYLSRKKMRKGKLFTLTPFAIAFLMLVLYFFLLFQHAFIPDDEELLKLTSVNMLLNGTDPYSTSIEPLLYANLGIGVTMTTQNTLLSLMDYPSLFFLLFLPFYPLAPQAIPSFNSFYLPAQATVFIFILLLVFVYLLDKKYLLRPPLMLLAFLVFVLANTSLMTGLLLIPLLLLAYARIGSRYAWLILGLCVSIQELLWLPVLLLLAYSLNNYGFWKTARNALGMIAVFLLFNGYFIAINPSAYVHAVFLPVDQLVTPFSPPPFAFLFMSYYPLLISTYTDLFVIVSLLFLCLLMYWNRKELIPLMSLTPFFFLDHLHVSYFALFLFAFAVTLYASQERRKAGIVERELKNRKPLFALLVLMLVVAFFLTIYLSHAAYVQNFSVEFVPQSMTLDSGSNTTFVNGSISYHNLSNSTVYVFAVVHSDVGVDAKGLGAAIISNPSTCGSNDYRCLININRIELPKGADAYPLRLSLKWASSTEQITRASVVVYNSDYFYLSPSVGNNSA